MELPLTYYGNPILRKKCAPIKEITPEIRQLVADMFDTMVINQGIGIAAPQVGKAIRLFLACSYVETPDGQWAITPPKVYINPKLTDHSKEMIEDNEGCISIPGLRGSVNRPLKVTVEAIDLDGKPFKEELEGYNARIRMHDNDHINGVLFIDRLDDKVREKMEPQLRAIKKKFNS